MIKKLINRLLGKTSAEPQAPAEPGATAARKTRAPKAPKVAKARTKASAGGVPRQARVWSVDDLLALLDREGIEAPVLVGWSMGVQLALELRDAPAIRYNLAVAYAELGRRAAAYQIRGRPTTDQTEKI